ncbi:zinc finger domain-containing protein [Patescibacteria group bacterium]
MSKSNQELTGDRCPSCNGSGTIIADCGGFSAQVSCPDCAGTGLINSPNACKECKGSGTVIANMGFAVEVNCERCNGSGLEPLS